MEVAKHQDGVERAITEREAAEIIELWARQHSEAQASALSVGDVCEALSISDAEAMNLLAQVRGRSPALAPSRRLSPLPLAAIYAAAGISAVIGGSYTIWIMKMAIEGSRLGQGDVKGAVLGALWSVLCVWYFRRPIKRALTSLGRRVSQGMP